MEIDRPRVRDEIESQDGLPMPQPRYEDAAILLTIILIAAAFSGLPKGASWLTVKG
jgi:hypothetical protein